MENKNDFETKFNEWRAKIKPYKKHVYCALAVIVGLCLVRACHIEKDTTEAEQRIKRAAITASTATEVAVKVEQVAVKTEARAINQRPKVQEAKHAAIEATTKREKEAKVTGMTNSVPQQSQSNRVQTCTSRVSAGRSPSNQYDRERAESTRKRQSSDVYFSRIRRIPSGYREKEAKVTGMTNNVPDGRKNSQPKAFMSWLSEASEGYQEKDYSLSSLKPTISFEIKAWKDYSTILEFQLESEIEATEAWKASAESWKAASDANKELADVALESMETVKKQAWWKGVKVGGITGIAAIILILVLL